MHKIPNFAFGKVDVHNTVRLFLPALWNEDVDPIVTPERLALIYDHAVRSTIAEILPQRLSHWPATYATAAAKCRDLKGRLTFSSVDVDSDNLARFARVFLEKLEALGADYADAFFGHEYRGVKNQTNHSPGDPEARNRAMNDFIDNVFSTPDIWQDMEHEDGEWYADIGLEISREGHVLQWLDNARCAIIQHLLPKASEDDCIALARSSSRTNVYYSGTVFELSGFQSTPGGVGFSDRTVFLNVYSTDKEVSYTLENNIFSPIYPTALYPDKLPATLERLDKVAEALKTNVTCVQPGAARAEVRVKFFHAADALTTFPLELVRRSIVCFPAEIWWLVRAQSS